MKRVSILSAALVLLGASILVADDDYEKNETHKGSAAYTMASSDSRHTLYINECAACHMGYQPEFLPKRSWVKMMKGLEDHFGVDATLDVADAKSILAYLSEHAADAKPVPKKYRKMARSIPKDETPLRISQTPYFKKEHREIPKRLITQKEVKSIANCTACHTKADKGDYSERSIFIPNYGRWDD